MCKCFVHLFLYHIFIVLFFFFQFWDQLFSLFLRSLLIFTHWVRWEVVDFRHWHCSVISLSVKLLLGGNKVRTIGATVTNFMVDLCWIYVEEWRVKKFSKSESIYWRLISSVIFKACLTAECNSSKDSGIPDVNFIFSILRPKINPEGCWIRDRLPKKQETRKISHWHS